MIQYIGFRPKTAQKLWRTYPDAQKKLPNGRGLDLYVHAKTYLTRKFEEHNDHCLPPPKVLLAAVGLFSKLVDSLINLGQRISDNPKFKLNEISLHNLRNWAIMKTKKHFYKMKFLDAHVLDPAPPSVRSSRLISLGMLPLRRLNKVFPVPAPFAFGGKAVPVFYIKIEGGQIVPGWKAPPPPGRKEGVKEEGKRVTFKIINYRIK